MRFIIVFLALYGGMNFYVLRKIYLIWPGHKAFLWALIIAGILVSTAPILVRLLDRADWYGTAQVAALVGHTWMAVLFWMFCLMLAVDVWNGAVRLAMLTAPAAGRMSVPARLASPVALGLIAIVCIYSFIAARDVRLKEIHLRSSRLPAGAQPLRIVQISDLHLSETVGESMVRRIDKIIERARPDVLVATGDMIDIPADRARPMAKMLARVQAPLGKFAVTGNHEYYTGMDNAIAFFNDAGFELLRGKCVTAGARVDVVGIDDLSGKYLDGPSFMNEEDVLPAQRDGRFVLLLKHRPEIRSGAAGRFDLQLSGHTHGGQLWPFIYVVDCFFPLVPGLHDVGEGSTLYVSRGTGTWGPPMRFLAPPEVTLVVLDPA